MHRRAAAKRVVGDYWGVGRSGISTGWNAVINSAKDGKGIRCTWGPFDDKEEAARVYDAAALYRHRGCGPQ